MTTGWHGGLRLLYAVLLSTLCALVLAAHVHFGFERIRLRVVSAPQIAHDSSLTVPLPDLTRVAERPAAVILRLRGAPEAARMTVTLDGEALADLTLPPERPIRVDASAMLPPGPGRQLTIAADRGGWQLEHLEIANVHGFSGGLLSFVVVPRERGPDHAFPLWLLLSIWIGLVALRPRPDWPRGRIGWWLHRAGLVLVLALFVATLLAPLVVPYRILLAAGSALLCAAVLYGEPIARGWRHGQRLAARAPRLLEVARRLRPFPVHAIVMLVVLWSIAQVWRPDTGFTSLIRFGDQFQATALPALQEVPHAVTRGSGYDGQFYAQLALDPLLRSGGIDQALDAAGYRGRRILLPWMAHVLGLGQAWWVLQAYALLNVISWLLLAWLLLRWLPPGAARPTAAWAACLLSHGLLASLWFSLPDGPSMLLLTLAVLAVERNRHWLAAGILGMSGVARETNVLGGAMLPRGPVTGRTPARVAVQAVLVLAPLALWMAYLRGLGLSVGDGGIGNFAWPLTEYASKWVITIQELRVKGWDTFARFNLLSLIALTTQALVLLWYRDWHSPWWRLGIVYLGLMLVLGFSVWEGYLVAVTRVVLPMTFAFNVLLIRVRRFWALWALGNINVLHALELIRTPWIWQYL